MVAVVPIDSSAWAARGRSPKLAGKIRLCLLIDVNYFCQPHSRV